MTLPIQAVRRAAAATALAAMLAAAPLPATAQSAQDLFKEALAANKDAQGAQAPEVKARHLREADALLARIIEDHPDTRLGAMLGTGKPIGRFSRADVQRRLAEAEGKLSPEQLAALESDAPTAQAPASGADAAATAQAESVPAAPEWPRPLQTALLDSLDPSQPLDATLIETLRVTTDGAPVLIGAPPRLDRDGADGLTVTLTDLIVGEGSDEAARLGRLAVAMERRDEDHVAVTVDMSPELRFKTAVIRMAEPRITGVYNTELDLYPTFDASLSDIRVLETRETEDGKTEETERARLASITFTQATDDTKSALTGEGRLVAEGLTVLPEASGEDRFTLERAVFSASMTDIDKNGYSALVDLLEMAQSTGDAASGKHFAAVLGNLSWGGFGIEGRLEGAEAVKDGVPLARSGVIGLSLSGVNSGGTGDITLSLTARDAGPTDAGWEMARAAEDEIKVFPRGVVFTDAQMDLTLKSVPYEDLMKAALKERFRDREQAAMAAVSTANPQLVLDGLRLEAPEASLSGSGAATSLGIGGQPPAASGTVTLEGLDVLIAHVKGLTGAERYKKEVLPLLVVLKGLGRTPEDGDATGLVYEIAFDMAAGVTINSMSVDDLMGGR